MAGRRLGYLPIVCAQHASLHKANRVFPILHKVGNVCILLKFENNLFTVISHINFNSEYHDKYDFALEIIQLLTISNLFPLEFVQ